MKLQKRKIKYSAIFFLCWFVFLVFLIDGVLKFQTLVEYFGSYALVEVALLLLVIVPTLAVYRFPALISEFCNYYAYHENTTVVFYYDATALGSNYAVNDQDFHYVIVTEFERHGWEVVDVYLGNPMKHDEKYLLIRSALATLDTSRTRLSRGSSGSCLSSTARITMT